MSIIDEEKAAEEDDASPDDITSAVDCQDGHA
jgi:hypothetical protein